MKMCFLSSGDPRWSGFLQGVEHQFYHWPCYARLWANQDRGRAEAVLISEGDDYFFAPYILCGLTDDWSDLHSPYGYPGPLIRSSGPRFLAKALRLWSGAMRDRRVISGFIRLDPLATYPAELSLFGEVCIRGQTICVDLTKPEAVLHRQIRVAVRKEIERARAAGLTFAIAPPEEWNEFRSIYQETMERVRAARAYRYSEEHFRQLGSIFGDRLLIAKTYDLQGEALSSGVFIEHRGIIQHHLLGTRAAGLRQAASKLLVAEMMLAAQARGNRLMHLGGGRGGLADSLFQFKSAFSKERRQFATWHLRFAVGEYQKRVERAPAAARWTSPTSSFFPAYRALEASRS